MTIELTNKAKLKLLTGGKICNEDIIIDPILQDLVISENGEYVPDEGYAGFGAVVVEVAGEVIEEYDGSVRDENTPSLMASGDEVLADINGTNFILEEEI